MNQSHDAKKRRGWLATTHPLVVRRLKQSDTAMPACEDHALRGDALRLTIIACMTPTAVDFLSA